jgi:fumarate reductase subunit D
MFMLSLSMGVDVSLVFDGLMDFSVEHLMDGFCALGILQTLGVVVSLGSLSTLLLVFAFLDTLSVVEFEAHDASLGLMLSLMGNLFGLNFLESNLMVMLLVVGLLFFFGLLDGDYSGSLLRHFVGNFSGSHFGLLV